MRALVSWKQWWKREREREKAPGNPREGKTGEQTMGVGGELSGEDGMVTANIEEEAVDGKMETKTDAGGVQCNPQEGKNYSGCLETGLRHLCQGGFGQIQLLLGGGGQTLRERPNVLIIPISAVDFIGFRHLDRERNGESGIRDGRSGVLGNTQPYRDLCARDGRRGKTGRRSGEGTRGGGTRSIRTRRNGNGRHGEEESEVTETII